MPDNSKFQTSDAPDEHSQPIEIEDFLENNDAFIRAKCKQFSTIHNVDQEQLYANVIVSLWESHKNFDGRSPEGWITTIAHRRSVDLVKVKVRDALLSIVDDEGVNVVEKAQDKKQESPLEEHVAPKGVVAMFQLFLQQTYADSKNHAWKLAALEDIFLNGSTAEEAAQRLPDKQVQPDAIYKLSSKFRQFTLDNVEMLQSALSDNAGLVNRHISASDTKNRVSNIDVSDLSPSDIQRLISTFTSNPDQEKVLTMMLLEGASGVDASKEVDKNIAYARTVFKRYKNYYANPEMIELALSDNQDGEHQRTLAA